MFGIGMPELILILAVALIVIGPKKLPDLAKSLGKAMGEFKKATNDIKDSMQLDSGIQEVKTSFEDLEKELKKPVETVIEGEGPAPEAEGATETTAADAPQSDPPAMEPASTDLTEAELEEYSPATDVEAPAGGTPPEASPKTDKA